MRWIPRASATPLLLAAAACVGASLSGDAAWAQRPESQSVTIAIEPGKGIPPDRARAPAFLLDGRGKLIVIDQVRGFILGRFEPPPGLGSNAGAPAEGFELESSLAGPPLPPIPITSLKPQYGFPFMADGALAGSPCVADLDNNGRCEIVVATTEGIVHLLRDDGRTGEGWPQRISDGFYAPPAAGDLDGDRDLEIVLGGISGRVYAWNPDGSLVPGWPVRPALPGTLDSRSMGAVEFYGSAALGDIEADGLAEVCIASSQGYVWILDGTGRTLPGWPQWMPSSSDPPNPGSVFCSPALGDLDGDRLPEVVLPSNAYRIHAWHGDGRPVAGWPVMTPNKARAGYGGVALGDLDADGRTEVVVATENGFAGPAMVTVLGPDGVTELGWPYTLPDACNAGPALGDLTGDGLPEIVVATIGGEAAVVALEAVTGRPVPGWPVRLRAETVNAAPLITDVDGDGRNDVILAALSTGLESDAWIWALDSGGRQLRDFPVMLPHDEIVRAAPVTADLDADGDLELLAATERLNTLYVWDLDALCDPASMPWPGAAGSASRCACLETVEPPVGQAGQPGRAGTPAGGAAAGETGGTQAAPLVLLPDAAGMGQGLEPGSPTPPGDSGDGRDGMSPGGDSDLAAPAVGTQSGVHFELEQADRVRLVILNVTGSIVRTLLSHDLPPGSYTIYWDGKDDQGRPQLSGIYHVRLRVGGRARTQQLLLLK
jgi:hypothetical protein